MRIEAIERVDGGLLVALGREPGRVFTWRWLLDHSDDAVSVDPATKQRNVRTFEIPSTIEPTSVELAGDGSCLRLGWADPERETSCSAALFEAIILGPAPVSRKLWADGREAGARPVFGYDDVLADDRALLGWLDSIQRLGFGVVEGVPVTEEAATALAERIAAPRSTVFGSMWRLASEMDEHQDSAYSTTFLEPHTDSSYMTDAPGTQLFCCLERTGRRNAARDRAYGLRCSQFDSGARTVRRAGGAPARASPADKPRPGRRDRAGHVQQLRP